MAQILISLLAFLITITVLGIILNMYLRQETEKVIPKNKTESSQQQSAIFESITFATSAKETDKFSSTKLYAISGLARVVAVWAVLWHIPALYNYFYQRNLWFFFIVLAIIGFLLMINIAFLGVKTAVMIIIVKRQILITIGLLGVGLLSGLFTIARLDLIGGSNFTAVVLWSMIGFGLGIGFFSFVILAFDSKNELLI